MDTVVLRLCEKARYVYCTVVGPDRVRSVLDEELGWEETVRGEIVSRRQIQRLGI